MIDERQQSGEYKTMEDLCRRVDINGINKRVMESLIKAGAMDCLGDRGTLLGNIGTIMSLAQREQQLKSSGQSTMFDLWGDTVNVPMPNLDLEAVEISKKEMLGWEKELLGVYLSEHPFSPYATKAMAENTLLCGEVDAELDGQSVMVAGMVSSIHNLVTKDGQPSASVMLEDLNGKLEVMVWSRVFASTRDFWVEGNFLLVDGKVRLRADHPQLVCEHARIFDLEGTIVGKKVVSPQFFGSPKATEKTETGVPAKPRRLIIKLKQTGNGSADVDKLHKVIDILNDYPGDDDISIIVDNGTKVFKTKLPNMHIGICSKMQSRLADLVGEDRITTEGE
jgi:DNA polymerase III subunit alpha